MLQMGVQVHLCVARSPARSLRRAHHRGGSPQSMFNCNCKKKASWAGLHPYWTGGGLTGGPGALLLPPAAVVRHAACTVGT